MPQEKIYIFKLNETNANIIMKGLGELPSKITLQLILNLQKQFQDQSIPIKQPSTGKKKNKKKRV